VEKSIILFLLILGFLSPTLSVYGENIEAQEQIDDLWKQGNLLLEEEKYEDAFVIFDQILEITPGNQDAINKIRYAAQNIPFKHMTNLAYQGYAHVEVRNSDGWLVGFVESDLIRYWPIAVDEYIEDTEISEIVSISGKTFEKRIIVDKYEAILEDTYFGLYSFHMTKLSYDVIIFNVKLPGYTVEPGDTLNTTLTVLREVT